MVNIILFGFWLNFPLGGYCGDGDLIQNSVINEENFREILKFRIDSGDDILKNHLQKCSQNASFINKTTQNDLIDYCVTSVLLNKIINAIRESKYFSIICR